MKIFSFFSFLLSSESNLSKFTMFFIPPSFSLFFSSLPKTSREESQRGGSSLPLFNMCLITRDRLSSRQTRDRRRVPWTGYH